MPIPPASFGLKDLITFALASIGAVLGVMNMWRAIDRDRPKLKVIPRRAIPVGGADERIRFCIEAVNLSPFPLTITDIGFLHSGTKSRSAIITPILLDGGSWPRRLESRTSVTVYARGDGMPITTHRIRCAYATTACGYTFKGSTPVLLQLADELSGGT